MKNKIIAASLIFLPLFSPAQNAALTLAQCDSLALKNYPLLRQQELIEKTKSFTLENASKGYFPQVSINGQATYQSDVVSIPVTIPGLDIETPGKDQYKLYGEIAQPLTDIYTVGQQKQLYASNAEIQEQSLEVDLYKLKDRVHQLFFGILLMDKQLEQAAIRKKDIESGITKTNAAIANGTAYKSSADVLKAELLNNEQRVIELKATRKAYSDMLGLFINQSITETTTLIKPQLTVITPGINRPELKLYDFQRKNYDIQSRLVRAKSFPKFSLFFQAGVGRPAFNPYLNDFQFYYIGGLRLSWSISNYFTLKNERNILGLNQSMIDVQRETFLFNTNLSLSQKSSDIKRLEELIMVDNQVVALRVNIKNTAAAQLENGVITSSDYLREVNAEDQSQQSLLLHEIQLLIANYDYRNISGN